MNFSLANDGFIGRITSRPITIITGISIQLLLPVAILAKLLILAFSIKLTELEFQFAFLALGWLIILTLLIEFGFRFGVLFARIERWKYPYLDMAIDAYPDVDLRNVLLIACLHLLEPQYEMFGRLYKEGSHQKT